MSKTKIIDLGGGMKILADPKIVARLQENRETAIARVRTTLGQDRPGDTNAKDN